MLLVMKTHTVLANTALILTTIESAKDLKGVNANVLSVLVGTYIGYT